MFAASKKAATVFQTKDTVVTMTSGTHCAPDAPIDMTYRMPTYKAHSGWVAIANQKHYVSLCTCGAHHLVEFKRKHKKIKTGKGCINFKTTDVVPVGAVKNVIRHAIEHPK